MSTSLPSVLRPGLMIGGLCLLAGCQSLDLNLPLAKPSDQLAEDFRQLGALRLRDNADFLDHFNVSGERP